MNRYYKLAPNGPKSLSVRQPNIKKLEFSATRPTAVSETSPLFRAVAEHERQHRLIETDVHGRVLDQRTAAIQRSAAHRQSQQAGPALPPGFIAVNHRERAELGVRARG